MADIGKKQRHITQPKQLAMKKDLHLKNVSLIRGTIKLYMNDNIRVITISGVYKGPEQIRKPSASFAK